MEMAPLLGQAKKQLSDITGLKPLSVTRASRDEKGWRIGIEMLEMSRIPNSTDVLGCYEVIVSENGSLLSFHRQSTRLRAETSVEAVS